MGCRTLFCCKSAWSASRWGWLSIFLTSSWTRKCSASFTTACDNPGTLKSMSSFSTLVDSCPLAGLTVLVEWCPRDQTRYLSRFPWWILVHLRVSPFLIIGFLVLVGFVWCLCCFQRLLNPILSSNYLWRKSSVVVEVTHILSLIWFLQIPSQRLSRYNKLGVYRERWLHYILFDRTWILFVEQAVYWPNTPVFGFFSTSSACTMQDVVWSNQAHADLCAPYSWDSHP